MPHILAVPIDAIEKDGTCGEKKDEREVEQNQGRHNENRDELEDVVELRDDDFAVVLENAFIGFSLRSGNLFDRQLRFPKPRQGFGLEFDRYDEVGDYDNDAKPNVEDLQRGVYFLLFFCVV